MHTQIVGQIAQAARRVATGLDGSDSIPSVGEVEIFLHSFVPRLVLGIQSISYNMSTGGLSAGIRAADRRTNHASPSWRQALSMWTLVSTSPMGLVCNGDTLTFSILKLL